MMQIFALSMLNFFYDSRVRGVFYQAISGAGIVVVAVFVTRMVSQNLAEQNIATGFDYLNREAGFLISQSFIEYSPTDSYGRALLVGIINTLVVSSLGVAFATLLGFLVGTAQLARNPVLRLLARIYVEVLRNVPLLLCLFFWYAVLLTQLPLPRDAWEILPHVFLSNGGLATPSFRWSGAHTGVALSMLLGLALAYLFRWAGLYRSHLRPLIWLALLIPPILTAVALQPEFVVNFPEKERFRIVGGMRLTTEFTALLVGLSLSASAAIAEIVRAGIVAVDVGQRDASEALGLSRPQTFRLIIVPQALKLIIPPLTGTYLSLFKNSSLAVAVGYPDLVMVSNTTMNQTGQALECIAIYMSVYLAVSLAIALFMRVSFIRNGH